MTIKEMNINDLQPYENNPRINDYAIEFVAASIKEFGFKVPIVIDEDNVIIAGHTRLKAAQQLGLEKVPCIVADDLTPEQVKAFRLADNKTSEFAEWDFELLESEMEELEIDMQQFGFDVQEIDWADVDDLEEENYEEPKKTALQCPSCGHVDSPNHFKKVDYDEIKAVKINDYNVRYAELEDVDHIKTIADGNSSEIGFVLRPALEEAVPKKHLIVAEGDGVILGFCNFNVRKADGVTVIYEICTDYKYRGNRIGKAMIDFLNKPISLKCPVGNESNNFYEHCGFTLKEVQDGKKRKLNIWELDE